MTNIIGKTMYYALNILFFPFIFMISVPTLSLFPNDFLNLNQYQIFYFLIGNIVSFYFYYKSYKIIQNQTSDFGEFTAFLDGLLFILSIFSVAVLGKIHLNLSFNNDILAGYYAFIFLASIVAGILGLVLLPIFFMWVFIPVFRKKPLIRIIISIIILIALGTYFFIK
ncbi:hypothetical protein N5853_01195 [Bartonella sp. HY329]|uniref:hypothetical protein n=1 Tax=unclassified Bartonella TaxID=2645622 RepID=UPI0021C83CB0|nr:MULTISPECIES: hypothetical protein [unclassified Bartonella]UXM95302.1 hypothetical protein N5853_01195 [Bartonella sp. HY329]UXN09627.1 hypothetical protein N5852_01200 [Bartonella sp. HY328]